MRFYREALGLSDSAFTILRDLIHHRTGIYFDETRRDILADKLSARVIELGFNSFLDYYYYLKYDAAGDTEFKIIFNLITVNETYFFRELPSLEVLVNHLVPKFLDSEPRARIRIWSAACSTGEEPLTIAIMLKEAGLLNERIEILGTDASSLAVGKAFKGLYTERSFRTTPDQIRKKYFIPRENGHFQIDSTIHNHVRWALVNLKESAQIRPFATSHIILCRNVFIYFSPPVVQEVVNNLYNFMPETAYLIVGVSESLLKFPIKFEMKDINGSFIYVKEQKDISL